MSNPAAASRADAASRLSRADLGRVVALGDAPEAGSVAVLVAAPRALALGHVQRRAAGLLSLAFDALLVLFRPYGLRELPCVGVAELGYALVELRKLLLEILLSAPVAAFLAMPPCRIQRLHHVVLRLGERGDAPRLFLQLCQRIGRLDGVVERPRLVHLAVLAAGRADALLLVGALDGIQQPVGLLLREPEVLVPAVVGEFHERPELAEL